MRKLVNVKQQQDIEVAEMCSVHMQYANRYIRRTAHIQPKAAQQQQNTQSSASTSIWM
jgi:hypothetical protein